MQAVTAILLNYQRPTNIERIVERLEAQSECPEIIVINNGPFLPDVGRARTVDIPWNARCFVRHLFALYATTEWVAVLDDDLIPSDAGFLEAALRVAAARPEAITGAFGCYLGDAPPYYAFTQPASGAVEIIKGRFMLYRRALLGRVRLGRMPMQFGQRGDDIFLSLEIGRGQAVHWADEGLRKRLAELPPGGVGLEHDPKHYAYREAFCHYYVERLMDTKADRAEEV